MVRGMDRRRIGSILAGLAVACAVGAGAWLATNDCTYAGTRTTQDASGQTVTTEHCSSLIETNGSGVLVVLAFPVVFAVVGLLGVRKRNRVATWTSVLLLGALCVLGLATVGLFYLPSLVLLVSASAISPRIDSVPASGGESEGPEQGVVIGS